MSDSPGGLRCERERPLAGESGGEFCQHGQIDVEPHPLDPPHPGVENEVMRGREGVEEYYASLDAAWESVRVFGGEFRDLGDRVLWLGRMEGRGRGSGVPVHVSLGIIYDLRGGKTSRVRSYRNHGEALRAAGLGE